MKEQKKTCMQKGLQGGFQMVCPILSIAHEGDQLLRCFWLQQRFWFLSWNLKSTFNHQTN